MEDDIKKSDFVQSLEKGLKVIHAFTDEETELTLTEVAGIVGLTRANARRILLTLKHLGYVSCPDNKYFRLTPKVLSLGYSYLSGLPFRELAMPYLQEVTHKVNESCSMSVLDGHDIVYVARVHTERIMRMALAIGTRLPVYCTSMGKAMMAHLPERKLKNLFDELDFQQFTPKTLSKTEIKEQLGLVRKQGFAVADEELEIGVRSIAVPIFDHSGDAVAAINISGHASRVTIEEMKSQYLPVIRAAVDQIENALKHID